MRLLIVTPIHNERANIVMLARQLAASSLRPDLWVVVDDGSTDGSMEFLRREPIPFETSFVSKQNEGGLIGGSAFRAWQFGIDSVADAFGRFDVIMKLDADVELDPTYLEKAMEPLGDSSVGLSGGVLIGKRDREQNLHVPGPVKMYTSRALMELSRVPRAVGFDVMDEVALKVSGYRVVVLKDLGFRVRRAIGASQGRVHGRRRNGQVCRWVGYSLPYFLLHVLRYAFRAPAAIGSAAMVWGYCTAGTGPYPRELRIAHAAEQRAKLQGAVRHPVGWVRDVYAEPPGDSAGGVLET